MNLATNTLAVFDPNGVMAGLIELWDSEPHVHDFVYAVVHPHYQGLGIGTALAGWVKARVPSGANSCRWRLRGRA